MENSKKKFTSETLPENYREWLKINLFEEMEIVKNLSRLEIILAGLLFLLGINLVSISEFTRGTGTAKKVLLLILCFAGFLVVRELIHACILKLFGAEKIDVEIKPVYSTVSAKTFFFKMPYLLICLLPLLITGAILVAICTYVPKEYFWCVYPAVIANFSGSSADYYVIKQTAQAPDDVLVLDEGTAITLYSAKETDPKS